MKIEDNLCNVYLSIYNIYFVGKNILIYFIVDRADGWFLGDREFVIT